MTKVCDICQISFPKEHAFKGHLSGKNHVIKMLTEQIDDNIELNNLLTILKENKNFESQLNSFLKIVTPHGDVNGSYKRICLRLNKLFRKSFPMCKLFRIGSTLTGLCLKNDHLKIYINIGETINLNENVSSDLTLKKFFSTAKSLLYRYTPLYCDVKLFSKVPKIKFVDKETKITCELHFSNGLSVFNSQLIKHYISMDNRIKPLMMIIKYWTRICGFSTEYIYMVKSSGLFITTYALSLLLIFYLQQSFVDLVPSILKLQENCDSQIIANWQVNFNENIHYLSSEKNTSSIVELLCGFFQFYAKFDFQKFVICPIDGHAHAKELFKNIDNLPESMKRYKEYIKDNDDLLFDIKKSLCIQDPIELNKNCTNDISSEFVKSFQEHVSVAAEICAENLQNSTNLLVNLFNSKPMKRNNSTLLSVTTKTSLISEKKNVKPMKNRKIKYKRLKHNMQKNENFEDQLKLFLNEMTLKDDVKEALYEPILEQLNQLFQKSFPMCKIHQLGSIMNGLCFKKSDLDVYLNIVETISLNEKNTLPSVLTFRKISSIALMQLLESSYSYRKIVSVLKGKMPIIKFTDKKTKITCELSFKNQICIYNSHLIKYYLSIDTRLKLLIMIVKFWAKLCGFKIAKITNYSLIWLCIFYLQQSNVNIVPSVIKLKNDINPEIIDGWQVNFNETIKYPSFNYKTIPELLCGFFEFYAYFDFEQFVICPIDGYAHPKEIFKNVNILPESMNRYVEYVKNTKNPIPLNVETTFCLQDPIELNVNCTFTTPDYFLNVFRKHMSIAANICSSSLENNCSNLLLHLFETVKYINKKETKKVERTINSDSSDSSS